MEPGSDFSAPSSIVTAASLDANSGSHELSNMTKIPSFYDFGEHQRLATQSPSNWSLNDPDYGHFSSNSILYTNDQVPLQDDPNHGTQWQYSLQKSINPSNQPNPLLHSSSGDSGPFSCAPAPIEDGRGVNVNLRARSVSPSPNKSFSAPPSATRDTLGFVPILPYPQPPVGSFSAMRNFPSAHSPNDNPTSTSPLPSHVATDFSPPSLPALLSSVSHQPSSSYDASHKLSDRDLQLRLDLLDPAKWFQKGSKEPKIKSDDEFITRGYIRSKAGSRLYAFVHKTPNVSKCRIWHQVEEEHGTGPCQFEKRAGKEVLAHVAEHFNYAPYKCNGFHGKCTKQFPTKERYNDHCRKMMKKSTAPETKVTCTVIGCDQRLLTRNVKRHIKVVHPDQADDAQTS